MITLTANQILEEAQKESSTTQRRIINRLFRKQDESDMWPINGKFNVTERAIRHAQKFERDGGAMSPMEYALFLEQEMSRIVNDEKNW